MNERSTSPHYQLTQDDSDQPCHSRKRRRLTCDRNDNHSYDHNHNNPNDDNDATTLPEYRPGDTIDQKFTVCTILGRGTFSVVYQCVKANPPTSSLSSNMPKYAIKVIANKQSYVHAAMSELKLIKLIHQEEERRAHIPSLPSTGLVSSHGPQSQSTINFSSIFSNYSPSPSPHPINHQQDHTSPEALEADSKVSGRVENQEHGKREQDQDEEYEPYDSRSSIIEYSQYFTDADDRLCLVSPVYGMNLRQAMSHMKMPFLDSHIRLIAYQLLSALAYCHDLTIIHGDIKPENVVLVSRDPFLQSSSSPPTVSSAATIVYPASLQIKLIDFGTAFLDSQDSRPSIVCTPRFRAPELLQDTTTDKKSSIFSYPVDVWACACVLYELFTTLPLFSVPHLSSESGVSPHDRDQALLTSIRHRVACLSSSDSVITTNDVFANFVSTQRKLNPSFFHLLQRMLQLDPNQRITAYHALSHPYFDCLPWK